ncbi:MAG: hypothetical protein AAGM22_08120 [Acidobacteriota bacterium]
MESVRMMKKKSVGRWWIAVAAAACVWLGAVAGAQEAVDESAAELQGTIVTLGVGVPDGALQAYEIGSVPDGPPAGNPTFVEVEGLSVGLAVGVLDGEEEVVEVQVFQGEDEPLVALLIERDVDGYVDLDDGTSLVVALQGIRRSR